MTGVIETDALGHVTSTGVKHQPVYSPHLLLGLPDGLIIGGCCRGRPQLLAALWWGVMGALPACSLQAHFWAL